MSKTIIFLDFDGVLCDSVKEAYILTRFAYFGIDVYKPIEPDIYKKFLSNRYLISNSPQYYYLTKINNENKEFNPDDIKIKFDELISKEKNKEAEEFNKKFLSKRKELIENDFEFWDSLETPTLFFNKFKKIINSKNPCIAILSTKNKEAIIKKFSSWKLDFNKNFIFDKKDLKNVTKGEFINNYLNIHKEYSKAILIDDNEDNIKSCANIKDIKAYLTSWGYVKNLNNAKNEEEILKIIEEQI